MNTRGAEAWYHGKPVFIVFALLIIITVVSVLAGISLQHSRPPTSDGLVSLVSFTCRISSSNQTFTVNTEVNLADGMDEDEAIRVATAAHAHLVSLRQGARPDALSTLATSSSTANVHENGVWSVKLEMAYVRDNYCNRAYFTLMEVEEFEATIDPFVHTITADVGTRHL